MRSPLYSLIEHTEKAVTVLGGTLPTFGMSSKQVILFLLAALLAPFIVQGLLKLVLIALFGFFDFVNSCCLSVELICNRFTRALGSNRVAHEFAGSHSSGRYYSYRHTVNHNWDRVNTSPAPPEVEDPILEHCMVLGVPRTASLQDVRRAFRREIKKVHPDTAARENPEFAAEACRRSRKVTGAYRALSEHFDRPNALYSPF